MAVFRWKIYVKKLYSEIYVDGNCKNKIGAGTKDIEDIERRASGAVHFSKMLKLSNLYWH